MRYTITKKLILLFLSFLLLTSDSYAQRQITSSSPGEFILPSLEPYLFEGLINEIRHLDSASYRIGFSFAPGEFFHLSRRFLSYGNTDDFKQMLKDNNPLVRVMGLICLSKSISQEEFLESTRMIGEDKAKIIYTNGCLINQAGTVGQIRNMLADGRFFIGEGR